MIPVYNVEKYFERCINSILAQTYQNFEVILLDDGSTDSSGLICDKFSKFDDRIKAFHQLNQGPILARRNGMVHARGDYYLFLDSDDYWDEDLLETVNRAINRHHCDMVIFNFKIVTPRKITVSESLFENNTIFDKENKVKIFELVIRSGYLNNLWNKVIKSTIIDDINYTKYEKVSYGEDLLQSLPLLYKAERILYLDKAMYNYCMNPSGLTQNFNVQRVEDTTIIRGVVLNYMKMLQMDSKRNLTIFYRFYVKYVLEYIAELFYSKTPPEEKRRILLQIQEANLYRNALLYIDGSGYTTRHAIRFYLFKYKHYTLLELFEKMIIYLKKVYHLIKRKKRRGIVRHA